MGPTSVPSMRPPPLTPEVSAPANRDISYYKSLIQQHGGERRDATSNAIFSPWLHCNIVAMANRINNGYIWAVTAGFNAAVAAISAKYFSSQWKYSVVILFNVTMWGCFVNSMKSLSSLQATVTNFATNFLSSGLAGYFFFEEELPLKWFAGALLIVFGVIVLSKSGAAEEKKAHTS